MEAACLLFNKKEDWEHGKGLLSGMTFLADLKTFTDERASDVTEK